MNTESLKKLAEAMELNVIPYSIAFGNYSQDDIWYEDADGYAYVFNPPENPAQRIPV